MCFIRARAGTTQPALETGGAGGGVAATPFKSWSVVIGVLLGFRVGRREEQHLEHLPRGGTGSGLRLEAEDRVVGGMQRGNSARR